MGFFGDVHGWEKGEKAHPPLNFYTYPTMMKLGTVIS